MMKGLFPGQPALTGCLLITHFPAKAELLRRPGLDGVPFALTADSGGGSGVAVLDCSPAAAGRVKAGQPVSIALSSLPNLLLLPEDRLYLDAQAAPLQAAPLTVLDWVEPAGAGCWYLDLSGMELLYGGREGLAAAVLGAVDPSWRPRLGLADGGKFPARLAALRAEAGGWVSAPTEATELQEWLAAFPVSVLPLEKAVLSRLRGFGLRTLGVVSQLSAGELVDFLGPVGQRVQQLVRGADPEPVRAAAFPEQHSRRLVFPWLLSGESALLAAVQSLCEALWQSAPLSGRTVGDAALEGELLEGGQWRWSRELRFPAGSAAALFAALKSGLTALEGRGRRAGPLGELTDLTLTVLRLAAEAGLQSGLEQAVGESRARSWSGIAGVERLAPVDLASPVPERRWVLGTSRRALVEPALISVECLAGVPRWIGGSAVKEGNGRLFPDNSDRREVSAIADCWELETGWWSAEPVSRRYWRLAVADGGGVTLYQDLCSGSWFRQGG